MDDCAGDSDSGEFQPEGEGKCTEIVILGKGKTFLYVVPSFPVYKATLQEVKLQYCDCEGKIHVFDGFVRKCDRIDHPLPAMARLPYSYENAFIIQVSY